MYQNEFFPQKVTISGFQANLRRCFWATLTRMVGKACQGAQLRQCPYPTSMSMAYPYVASSMTPGDNVANSTGSLAPITKLQYYKWWNCIHLEKGTQLQRKINSYTKLKDLCKVKSLYLGFCAIYIQTNSDQSCCITGVDLMFQCTFNLLWDDKSYTTRYRALINSALRVDGRSVVVWYTGLNHLGACK